jgi:hypothetical protein
MDAISRSLGLDEWSRDPEFLRKLDDAYRKDLRLCIQTDGSYNAGASAAWKSYCFELAQIFSERFSSRKSVGYFRELSESYTRCFKPVITASYIEDLVKQWEAVRYALLEASENEFIDTVMMVDRVFFYRWPVGSSLSSTMARIATVPHHSTMPRSSLGVVLVSCCPARELRSQRCPDEPIA